MNFTSQLEGKSLCDLVEKKKDLEEERANDLKTLAKTEMEMEALKKPSVKKMSQLKKRLHR
eukprot:2292919-Rhodomonas_salina.1